MGAKRFYHPELDALRLFAFLAVFVHHAFPRSTAAYVRFGLPPPIAALASSIVWAGGCGVDLFFVLSAYLITELLLREREATGQLDIGAFYVRRALRIWPLYFVFLLASLFLFPRFLPNDQLARPFAIGFALFVGNWVCATRGWPDSSAGPLWSVSIEEQFYLFWPLALRWIRREHLPRVGLCMVITAVTTRAWLALYHAPGCAMWCNTFARLDTIGIGILAASLLHDRKVTLGRTRRLALGAMSVVAIVASASVPPPAHIGFTAISRGCVGIRRASRRRSV